ncbi:MAG: hypothetical protein NC254_05755 [bacterium]|nr:hypothetical protein [bacterium]
MAEYAGKENSIKKNIRKQLLFFLVSAVYLLFFSAYTSPLFPKFLNYDSAIFMMVGKGILAGKELYVDIFDHKGPLLFWLEAVGMAGGRTGIYFLQVMFLWADLFLLDRIMGLFFGKAEQDRRITVWEQAAVAEKNRNAKRCFVIGMTLLMLSYPLANGNLSEEYSLPFIFLPLYLFLRDYVEREKPLLRSSYVYGLCFGVLAFIRLNNAVTIAAIILYWVIVLVMRRKGMELLRHLGIGMLGILTVAAPIAGWFVLRGSFYDMIYASFLFNFRYSAHMSFLQNLTNLNTLTHMVILFTPLFLAMLVFAVRVKDGRLLAALELIIAVNIASLFMGHGYNHYFTITVPIEALMCLCMVCTEKTIRKDSMRGMEQVAALLAHIGFVCVLAAYGILAARIVALNVRDYYIQEDVVKEYETVQECLNQIPEADRAYVLGYNAPAKYYLMGELLPCFRYGILQENWSRSDAVVMEEVIQYLAGGDARWVMAETECSQAEVAAVLSERYELVEKNEYIALYRMK